MPRMFHFEVMTSKGWIRGNTKIGPELDVQVTHRLDQYRIEIRVVSMNTDGSPSWIVISRCMNKNVDKFHEENGESGNFEEMVTNAGSTVATKPKEQSTPPLLYSQRCLYQLTNGSGVILLPSTMSTRDLIHVESRRQRLGLIEKMVEQWNGSYCYKCYVKIS